VISDFLDEQYDDSLKLLAKKHDVVALQVIDEAEINLPRAGLLKLKDPETGTTFTVNSNSARVRASYNALAQKQQEELETRFKKNKIDLVTIRTDQSYVKELMKFFKVRLKRKNR
jgi:uncharacterized protein (DUF58 family)